MKPIKLTMTAFGPYAGQEEIDFSLLENRKMFVISGKTGSGKTTIFDAISFAMYGRPSGDNRSAQEMRSQFAQKGQLTEVELLFELKGRQYVIRRTPQQEKVKARGTGTTIAGATAELSEITDEGKKVLLAANVRDTDEKINELIGLEANQFRQILMIPQGEFQKLLMASSQDKEKILQKLFQTVFYKQVEDQLKEKADILKKEAGKTVAEQITMLKNLAPYSDEMRILLNEEDMMKDAVFKQLDIDMDMMQREHQTMKDKIVKIGKKRDVRVVERERGMALNRQFDQLIQSIEVKRQLDDRQEQMQSIALNIVRGEKAEKVHSYEAHVQKAEKALVLAHERKKEAVQNKKSACAQFEQAKEVLKREESRQPERDKTIGRYQQLESMKESVYAFEEAMQNESTYRKQLENTVADGVRLREMLREMEQKISEVERSIKPLELAGERFIEADRLVEKTEQLLELHKEARVAASQLSTLEAEGKETEQRFIEATQKAVESKKQVLALRQELKREQAALLALQLTEGEPCAVCGSIHHPKPAYLDNDDPLIREEAVEEAEKHASLMERKSHDEERKLSSTQFAIHTVKKEMEKMKTKLPKDQTIEDVQEMLQCVKMDRQTAEHDREKKQKLAEQLQLFNQQKEMIVQNMEQNRQTEAAEQRAYIEAHSFLLQMKKNVPDQMRNVAKFIEAFDQVKQQVEQDKQQFEQACTSYHEWHLTLQSTVSILNEREQAMIEADASFKDAAATFSEKLLENEFVTEQSYQEAKRFVDHLLRMKESVERYNEEQRAIHMKIRELEKATDGLERINLDELSDTIDALNDEMNEWTHKAGMLAAQMSESMRTKEAVMRLSKQIARVEEEYRLAGHMYDITHGKNELKVTFERYILASFLEDILIAANTRLIGMTNGRFRLERQTERAKGNAQSGLDLLTFDQYTGASRHVKTLSGGESFKAALALALGLAEVVQNYAGGVSLETMFVDEGFGTLDPESLDQAIETLMDIQSDGRLVGIISHVPELKERIDARLEVKQSEVGSKAMFVFSGEV
ncbi:SbcC/MukB-like Walker B domain-containing protein [Domibacillus aminovorans]|uniref:Nuclease SbcCD subunit C n=1 Tax=Domibacillus aminovorans TaxID=29332 RepID=A0A177LEV7_9BACI|nr:SMC family ATPase [Domibacillus aminovorans]OAH63081.1 hypothetical protein AWH49_06980 [Domibacillus aminovorans]